MAVLAGQQQALATYPVDIEVDGPFPQSRLTVLFRFLMVIPHALALGLLGIVWQVVLVLSWFAILITGKNPHGLSDFSVRALHWNTRMLGYMFLLTGKFPQFAMGPDAAYPVRLVIEPQLTGRNRLTVLFRISMLIPHIFVICAYMLFMLIGSVLHFIAFWFALFTGSVPLGIHNFLVLVVRNCTRYYAYALLLVDDYPPFGTN